MVVIGEYLTRFFSMWRCAWIVSIGCFKTVWKTRFKENTRRYVTKKLHQAGIQILKSINAHCTVTASASYQMLDHSIPKIYMSNHLSLFDLPLITANISENIRVVIKKELTKVPFIGKAALASEQVIIDRQQSSQHAEFYRIAKEKLLSGISLWIFPEGTRSRTGEMFPFKLGGFRLAAEMGAQIIPTAIVNTHHILPAGKLLPRLNQSIAICIGDPIPVKNFDKSDLTDLVNEVSTQIAQLKKSAELSFVN